MAKRGRPKSKKNKVTSIKRVSRKDNLETMGLINQRVDSHEDCNIHIPKRTFKVLGILIWTLIWFLSAIYLITKIEPGEWLKLGTTVVIVTTTLIIIPFIEP